MENGALSQAAIDALLGGGGAPDPVQEEQPSAPISPAQPEQTPPTPETPPAPPKTVTRARPTIITTGNSEIDKKLGGGIPPGCLILVEGESDAGKSVLCQQIMHGSLSEGMRGVLYTSEDTTGGFVRQMQSLSLDILDFYLLARLNVYEVPNTFGEQKVFDMLLAHINKLELYSLVIIDSMTSFVLHASEAETLEFFSRAKQLCDKGRTIIVTLHSFALTEQFLSRIRSMSDGHLKLRTEEIGTQIVKVLEVAKIRGASKTTGNIVPFDVEPRMGIRIIPITKAQA